MRTRTQGYRTCLEPYLDQPTGKCRPVARIRWTVRLTGRGHRLLQQGQAGSKQGILGPVRRWHQLDVLLTARQCRCAPWALSTNQ